jgi:hypothetical protein
MNIGAGSETKIPIYYKAQPGGRPAKPTADVEEMHKQRTRANDWSRGQRVAEAMEGVAPIAERTPSLRQPNPMNSIPKIETQEDALVPTGTQYLDKKGKFGAEFRKESSEHPSLPKSAVGQIVKDHAKVSTAEGEMFTGKQGPMATGKMNQENLAKNQATGPKYSGKDYGTKNVQGTIEKAFGEVLRQATYQDQMTSMLDESSGKPQHETNKINKGGKTDILPP